MSAQGPTCALARFSFVTSTRAKARHNFNRSGPFLRRDLVPFYSAIDTSVCLVPGLIRRVTWQEVVRVGAVSADLFWLQEAMKEKHGIHPNF
jgi:hypothetical protein